MPKHLYFVCPTDHLEAVINRNFKQENYYLSSLGNSITFDNEFVKEMNALIEALNIKEITFVLSDKNRMINDALKNHNFQTIKDWKPFMKKLLIKRN